MALRHYDAGEWRPPVLKTEALRGTGVDEVWAAVQRCRHHQASLDQAPRVRDQHSARVRDAVARRALEQVAERIGADEWARLVTEVMAREVDPDAAADRLLARAFATRKDPA